MKIEFSKHALRRMEERGIPNPYGAILKAAGRKTRRKIRESCKQNGVKYKDCIYFMLYRDNILYVYVCVQVDIGEFICITALKYEK